NRPRWRPRTSSWLARKHRSSPVRPSTSMAGDTSVRDNIHPTTPRAPGHGPAEHQAPGIAEFKAVASSVLEYGKRHLALSTTPADDERADDERADDGRGAKSQEREWNRGRRALFQDTAPLPVMAAARAPAPVAAHALGWARPSPRYAGLGEE